MYLKVSVNTVASIQYWVQVFARSTATVLAALVLTACAGLPLASEEESLAAKRFAPDPENGSIYIFQQKKGKIAQGPIASVFIDGRLISEIEGGTFLYIKVPPGQHDLSSKKGGRNLIGASVTPLTVEKGKLYFVQMTYDRGWTTVIPVLTVIDEEAGKKKVLERDLVKTGTRSGQSSPTMF